MPPRRSQPKRNRTPTSLRPHSGQPVTARYFRSTRQPEDQTMTVSKAKAGLKGNLREGAGRLAFGTGLFEGPYGFKTRTEGGRSETTPEELIAAAHAACFSMALSAQLTTNKTPPTIINTEATVRLNIS